MIEQQVIPQWRKRDGVWCVVGDPDELTPGSTIQVPRKSGEISIATIDAILTPAERNYDGDLVVWASVVDHPPGMTDRQEKMLNFLLSKAQSSGQQAAADLIVEFLGADRIGTVTEASEVIDEARTLLVAAGVLNDD